MKDLEAAIQKQNIMNLQDNSRNLKLNVKIPGNLQNILCDISEDFSVLIRPIDYWLFVVS